MSNHILVIADQALDGSIALRKAAEFVGASDSRATVLAFTETSEEILGTSGSPDERLRSLTDAATKYLAGGIATTVDLVCTSNIADYCAEFCQQHHIDLVVKTGHRSESLIYTPLDWQLIRTLPCPIIIAVDHEISKDRKILVALDIHSNNPAQQQLDKKVLAWAGKWARDKHFTLTTASCIEAPEPLTSTDMDLLIDLEAKMRPKMEPVILRLLNELSLTSMGNLIGAGPTDVVLCRLARELNADLVVMGYTARHGLGNLLVGHTAEKVMHQLDRNLAIVQNHTDDESGR